VPYRSHAVDLNCPNHPATTTARCSRCGVDACPACRHIAHGHCVLCRDRSSRKRRTAIGIVALVSLVACEGYALVSSLHSADTDYRRTALELRLDEAIDTCERGFVEDWFFRHPTVGSWVRTRHTAADGHTTEQVEWLIAFPRDNVARVRVRRADLLEEREIERAPLDVRFTHTPASCATERSVVKLGVGSTPELCGVVRRTERPGAFTDTWHCPMVAGGIGKIIRYENGAQTGAWELLDVGYTNRYETAVID